jgi:MFS family permease
MGGWLTAPLAAWRGVPSASAEAYAIALAVAGAMALVGAAPVALMRRRRRARPGELDLSPLQYARAHPRTLATLVGPMLVTSVGAGLFMPFINVFYRVAHGSSDSQIGTLLAVGSLAMAAGLLIAPPLADRFGKVEVVVATQALSIPFLVLLGFAPVFWLSGAAYLVRLALMNMSNPVYQSFVMEQVDENARATVASLVSMAWSFGWAFSPVVSGQLQESSGFGVVYGLVIVLYTVAVLLYWRFFLGSPRETVAAVFRRRGLRR